jgi:hypothetical protein
MNPPAWSGGTAGDFLHGVSPEAVVLIDNQGGTDVTVCWSFWGARSECQRCYATNPAVRREMSELADLVGGVWLATCSHLKAAGTAIRPTCSFSAAGNPNRNQRRLSWKPRRLQIDGTIIGA